MSKAQDILASIRNRQHIKDIDAVLNPKPYDPEISKVPLNSDDWHRFKAVFVEEYGGEKVQPFSGMTNNEFLKYIKTAGYRENSEFDKVSLKELLRRMESDDYN